MKGLGITKGLPIRFNKEPPHLQAFSSFICNPPAFISTQEDRRLRVLFNMCGARVISFYLYTFKGAAHQFYFVYFSLFVVEVLL